MGEFYFPLCASALSNPAVTAKSIQLGSCHQLLCSSSVTSLASLGAARDALSMPCFLAGYAWNCAHLLLASSPSILLFLPFHRLEQLFPTGCSLGKPWPFATHLYKAQHGKTCRGQDSLALLQRNYHMLITLWWSHASSYYDYHQIVSHNSFYHHLQPSTYCFLLKGSQP